MSRNNRSTTRTQIVDASAATSALIDAPAEDGVTPAETSGETSPEPAIAQDRPATDVDGDKTSDISEPETRDPRRETRSVMIEIPLAPPNEIHYAQQHLRQLSGRQARILRRIADGLIADGATLPGGKPVAGSDDAIVWWLERVLAAGASAGATTTTNG